MRRQEQRGMLVFHSIHRGCQTVLKEDKNKNPMLLSVQDQREERKMKKRGEAFYADKEIASVSLHWAPDFSALHRKEQATAWQNYSNPKCICKTSGPDHQCNRNDLKVSCNTRVQISTWESSRGPERKQKIIKGCCKSITTSLLCRQ